MTTTIDPPRGARRPVRAGAPAPAFAQSGRPITMMHGFTPGRECRHRRAPVADISASAWARPIVVEPRPGAGGTTSAAAVARAAPDGTTLTILPGGHAVSAAIYNSSPMTRSRTSASSAC